jgi:hypothetical protein
VHQITIDNDLVRIDGATVRGRAMLDAFARDDGFGGWPDLLAFFAPRGLPFTGSLICWNEEARILRALRGTLSPGEIQ